MEEQRVAGNDGAAAPEKDRKPTTDEILQMYRSFMEEVKVRKNAIDRYLKRIDDEKGMGDTFTDAESCLLQVRYICELVALSTVAAHSLIGVSNDILGSWGADKTFKLLEGMNANSFPRAVRASTTVDGQFDLLQGECDRAELKDIYAACGNVLHRGAMKHFLKEGRRAYEPEQLVGWVNRIKALLDLHVVMILEQGIIILVQMADVNGNVAVHLSQADGPAILIEK